MNKIIITFQLTLISYLTYSQDYLAYKTNSRHTDKIDVIATCDKYYATGADDGFVFVRDYNGKMIFKYKAPEGRIDALSFLKDSNTLLVALAEFNSEGYKRYIIKSFDISGKLIREYIDSTLTQDQVDTYYQQNTTGSANAIEYASKIYSQFNIKANSGIPQVKEGLSHIEVIQSISVSKDQKSFASIDKFNILKIWNSSGKIMKSYDIINNKKDTHVYFISDTTILVTPNIILNINSDKSFIIDGYEDYMSIPLNNKIYFYFDYTKSSEDEEKLINIQTDSTVNIDTKNVYSLKASASNDKFALLGIDGLIRIRDINGDLLSTFGADRSDVITFRDKKLLILSKICDIEFSPNGDYLITGDEYGKEIIWKYR